ncbi:MAG: glycosyltransferase family 2 protein [Bacteroidetes bacterium]|nr:MAG: glycosyltransferase family 2 protein [Bacteroidota bacterium]
MKLSVIIPVYNERATIMELIRRVQAVDYPKEIILVDDTSTDGTREILQEYERQKPDGIKFLYHPHNQGKGAAYKTGTIAVEGDIVVVQDADLEYDPEDYHKLLKPILDGRADVVFGSRFVGSEEHRVLYFWHYMGNKFLTLFINMVTNLNLSDMETCYKMIRTEVLRKFTLQEPRFGFDPEFTAKVAKLRCRIYEVGVSYSGRDYSQGKKITWKDGIRVLWCILKYGL